MQNLLPRSYYDYDELGIWKRIPIISGVLFGLSMGLVSLLFGDSPTVGSVIGIALFSGLSFGIIFPRMLRRKFRSITDRLYNCDSTLITQPSTPNKYSFRMPCTLNLANFNTVGGILFIGHEEWVFVPYRQNLPQHQTSVEIKPTSTVVLRTVLWRINRWIKEKELIEVQWSEGTLYFTVPQPNETKKLLESKLQRV